MTGAQSVIHRFTTPQIYRSASRQSMHRLHHLPGLISILSDLEVLKRICGSALSNNATLYEKLGKKRRESSKHNDYITSPRVTIKAIITINVAYTCNVHPLRESCIANGFQRCPPTMRTNQFLVTAPHLSFLIAHEDSQFQYILRRSSPIPVESKMGLRPNPILKKVLR